MELLGLDEDELCQALGVDALTLVGGELDHLPAPAILLELLDEAGDKAGPEVLRRWVRARGPAGRPEERPRGRSASRSHRRCVERAAPRACPRRSQTACRTASSRVQPIAMTGRSGKPCACGIRCLRETGDDRGTL